MAKYDPKLQEEELKLHVAEDWFPAYDCKRKIGKIDFCVDIPADTFGGVYFRISPDFCLARTRR